jgi:hypothetical protein
MKKRMFLVLLAQLMVMGMSAQVSFGKAEKFNSDWHFLRIDTLWNVRERLRKGERMPESRPDMKDADFDDSRWRRVSVPHDWGVEQPMSPDKGSCQGYLPGGIAWYRKHFRATDAPKQYVYFEGVYNNSEVYLNGHLLGKRPSGFASFMYDMTPYLNRTGENVLAVRVNHSEENDSRWYTGSGIYRNVWLISAPEVHLAQWGTAYRLKTINKKKAELEVDVETTDCRTEKSPLQLQATIELKDAEGRVVAKVEQKIGTQEKKTVKLNVAKPQRWTLDNPYLYTLTTRLSNGDASEVKVGLRTLQFSPDKGFALNGEWMKVKGVCVHDDAGVLGTAVPKEVWRRRIAELKSLGANALRLSHNPHAPELYDLCDEMGMLIMDEASDEWEFPKRKWLKGWNQGAPGFQGTYSYFEEWIDRDVADMVRRDRCHPSVFMWSIGNEVDYPNDPYSHPVLNGSGTEFTQPVYGGYKPEQPNAERIGLIAQRLSKIVRDIDTSRPTTGALAGVVMSNETAYPDAIDVVGYNYTESRYGVDHKKYPKRVLYGSENRHDLAAWKAVSENEHIFGQFLWTGIDYLGESGVWPARGSSAGLLDLAGQRKPNGWYRAALWSNKPVCYIGTYAAGPQRFGSRQNNQRTTYVSPYANDTWNYEDGQKVRVVCYTNAKSAHLQLNGQTIGGEPTKDENSGILYWDIDYAPGTLSCVADNGSSYEVKTVKAPHALKVTTDSLAHVFIEVVDEDGNLVKNADHEVTLFVRGARLLGMENGNMSDVTVAGRLRPNRLRVYGGRLVAYIEPATEGGQLTIRASSPLLPNPTTTISINR